VGLTATLACLLGCVLASLAIGSLTIPVGEVIAALTAFDNSDAHVIVTELRVPRTEIGLLVGAALGAAGALMQGVTRNPLADPGILGINAGAAFAVVLAISVLGVSTTAMYASFALLGAGMSAVAVYALGASGRDGATPIKLALAGAVLTALLVSLTSAVLIFDTRTLDEFRFWIVGSIAGRDSAVVVSVAPFILAGLLVALLAGRWLNALALGDDVARSLGQRVGGVRAASAVGFVLPVRRSGRRSRPDRVRRADRPARRPGAGRSRLPLDRAVQHGARRDPAAGQRRARPRRRASRRARGRHRHGDARRAVLHLARTTPQAGGAVTRPRVAVRWRTFSLRVDVRVLVVLTTLAAATLVVFTLSIARGEFPIAPLDVLATLVGAGDHSTNFIVLDLRLPRALTAVLAGVALGIAGAIFQDLARNPLVAPDVIGITSGASLAAITVIVFGNASGALSVPLAALGGALVAGVVLYALAWRGGVQGYRLVLVGIGVAALLTAGINYVLTRGQIYEIAQAYVWLVGSLNGRGWEQVWPLAATLALLLPAGLALGRQLEALQLGTTSPARSGSASNAPASRCWRGRSSSPASRSRPPARSRSSRSSRRTSRVASAPPSRRRACCPSPPRRARCSCSAPTSPAACCSRRPRSRSGS
jgi:ABC-type Fe3+-siderophore transport system permease subunit